MQLKKYFQLLFLLFSISTIAQNQYDNLPIAEKILIKESNAPYLSSAKTSSGSTPVILTTGPEQQCNSAIPVCQNVYTTSASYSGNGTSQEIPSNTCLGSNELNSVWYTFTSSSAGNIAFNITPNVIGQDYDFALYNLTGTNCSAISSGALTPIRCNFSATGGVTGLSSSGTNPSEPASGPNQSTVLATAVGQTYVLIISNYSSSSNGYTLDFTPGTASIFDITPPSLASVTAPCGSNVLTLNTSEQITCASIAPNGSDISVSGTGGPYTVTGANGVNCGSSTAQIQFTITPALTGGGPWVLNAHAGSDGNSLIDNCGNAMPTTTVSFNVAPATPVITGPSTVCKGSTFALSSSSAISYTWSGAAVPAGQQNNQTISITANNAGTLNFTLVVSYGACGTATVTKAVTVTDAPIANFTALPSQTVCAGTAVTFTNTSTYPCSTGGLGINQCTCGTFLCNATSNQGTFATYLWTFGDGGTAFYLGGSPASSFSPVHTYTAPGTYNVSLNASGLINTCSNTKNLTITVLPATPALTLSPTTTICPGQSSTLTATGGTTYTWSPGASLNTVNGGTVIATPSITTTYSVSSPGCSGNQTSTVQVVVGGTPPVIGAISGTTTICPNQTGVTYSVINVASTNYTWSVPAGATITSAPTNSNAITVNFGGSAGTVSVTATGSCGTATAAVTVSLNPVINLTVTPSTSTICAGSSSTLNVSGATNYTWSPSASLSSSTGSIVVASPTTSTTYTVIGSTGTCTGSVTANVSIGGALTLSVTPNTSTICPGNTVTLSASGATNYTWSPSGSLSSSNGTSVTASPTTTTTYTVLGATGTCTGIATATVSMAPSLTISISPSTSSICAGNSTTLTANGATNYTWTPSISLSAANGSNVSASPTVNTTYTITGETGGCVSSTTANVSINAAPTISVTTSIPSLCAGNTAILSASGATSYTWSNAATLSSSNGSTVVASPAATTIYTVQGSSGGCLGTATISLAVLGSGFPPAIYIVQKNSQCDTTILNWLNVTSVTPTLAQGTLPSGLTVNATHSNGGMSTTPSMFSGGTFPASYSVPIAATTIRNDLGGTFNFCFNQSVINPQIAFASIGQVGLPITVNTSVPYQVLWTGIGMTYSSPTSMIGAEGFTIVRFPGIHTCISIDYIGDESYCNLAFGVMDADCQGQPICPGEPLQLVGGGASTYTWSNGATTSTIAPNPSVTTTYSLVGVNSSGCSNTAITTVTVNPTPTVTVNSSTICAGQQTATLTANGATSYTWSAGLSATSGSVVTGTPASTQNYTVTGEDINGCINNTVTAITVAPIPTLTVNSASICIGQQTATLTANGATNYSWTPSADLSASTGSLVTGTPTLTQSYSITGTDANGCLSSTTSTITVNSLPTISVNTSTICVGQQTATLTASGASTYSWIPTTNLSSATGSVVTGTPNSTENYTVGGMDANGCVNATVTAITVNPLPTITVNSASICVGQQTATLTANGATTYSWIPGTGLSTTTGSVVTGTPAVTESYTVAGADANGCINATVTAITVNPLPVLATSANSTVCPLSTNTLTVNGADTYTWSPNVFLNTNTASTVVCTPSVTTTYTIDATSTDGCTNTNTLSIVVNNTVVVTASASTPTICPLGSTSLTASGASSYTWTPSLNLSSANGGTVTSTTPSTETYTVIGATSTCTNSTQVVVTVTTNPVVSIVTSPSVICSGSSSILTASGASTYTWSPTANLNAATGTTVNANPNTTTTYSVVGASALGCIGTATTGLTVVPTPTITTSANPITICSGKTTTLTASGATNYTWSPIATLSNVNGSSTEASPVLTTTYTVIGTNGTAPFLCTSSSSIKVNAIANPTVIAGADQIICEGSNALLYAIGANTYTWSPNTGIVDIHDSTTNVYPQGSGVFIYTITGTSTNNCTGTNTLQVTVNPLPTVYAGEDTTINIDNTVTLFGSGNNYVQLGFVSGSDGVPLSCNYCPTVTVNPQNNTCYTLEAISSFGCKNTDVVCVTVTKDWNVYIPNAFTPNGDVNNEIFIPVGYAISEIKLSIFDRWGHEIFKSHDDVIGWDGTSKGRICEQGVYVYVAEITAMSGETLRKVGHVTLLGKAK